MATLVAAGSARVTTCAPLLAQQVPDGDVAIPRHGDQVREGRQGLWRSRRGCTGWGGRRATRRPGGEASRCRAALRGGGCGAIIGNTSVKNGGENCHGVHALRHYPEFRNAPGNSPVISGYTTALSRLLRGGQRLPAPDQPIFARIPAHFVTHRSGCDYRPPSHLFAAAAPAFPHLSAPPARRLAHQLSPGRTRLAPPGEDVPPGTGPGVITRHCTGTPPGAGEHGLTYRPACPARHG